MQARKNLTRSLRFVIPLVAFLCLTPITEAMATHFRYGHLSWTQRPDIATNTAEFSLFNSFRRDGYTGSGTDGHPITGDIISEFIGATVLRFGDGATLGGPLDYIVVAYDPAANWIYCKALADRNNIGLPIVHTYAGPGPWTADISSCCRISQSINAPDGNYRVLTSVNFATETSSPVSVLPTIVNCASGGICNFGVPAADPNGDTLHWRLASGAEDGDISQPSGITINLLTGAVTWNTAGQPLGLYSTQFVVEARTPGSGTLKSQVAVDFLINVTTSPPSGTAPVFDRPPTPSCGTTFDWVAGKPLSFTVRSRDNDAGNTVTLNAIGLPTGATMTPGLPVSGNPVSSLFDWTPTSAQAGPHVVIFTATDNTALQAQCSAIIDVKVDSDGDGLPDAWETAGYSYNGTFVNLPGMGANPNHKDIFVEIDYMVAGDHTHLPIATGITKIVNSFATVPNALFAVPNPDGLDGITLHVSVDDVLPHTAVLGTFSATGLYQWSAFDTIKLANFSEALSLSHHYVVFGHQYGDASNGSSGIARGIGANDCIVSLGTWPGQVGTESQQAGTFMHELGHDLGLRHGACENFPNYRPNYLSVMSYTFQTAGLRYNNANGLFDYSRFNLSALDENNLNENIGLNGGAALNLYGTRWYCGAAQQLTENANGTIDWNCNAAIEPSVASSINNDAPLQVLCSLNDWGNLNFKGGLIGAGIVVDLPSETPSDELDVETARQIVPFAPASLTASVTGCARRLSWIAAGPTDEWSYNVYRSTNGNPFTLLLSTTSAFIVDTTADPVKTYTYVVTAVNSLGTESGPSNMVTIKGGADLIKDNINLVKGFNLQKGIESSLLSKLQKALASANRGNKSACNELQAFVNEVRAQSGKKIPVSRANQLISGANGIRATMCCSP